MAKKNERELKVQTAAGATWMMQEYFRLAKIYTQIVNILLEDLFALKDYAGVCDYAARSFLIDPHNNHAHFWLFLSFIRNKNCLPEKSTKP